MNRAETAQKYNEQWFQGAPFGDPAADPEYEQLARRFLCGRRAAARRPHAGAKSPRHPRRTHCRKPLSRPAPLRPRGIERRRDPRGDQGSYLPVRPLRGPRTRTLRPGGSQRRLQGGGRLPAHAAAGQRHRGRPLRKGPRRAAPHLRPRNTSTPCAPPPLPRQSTCRTSSPPTVSAISTPAARSI